MNINGVGFSSFSFNCLDKKQLSSFLNRSVSVACDFSAKVCASSPALLGVATVATTFFAALAVRESKSSKGSLLLQNTYVCAALASAASGADALFSLIPNSVAREVIITTFLAMGILLGRKLEHFSSKHADLAKSLEEAKQQKASLEASFEEIEQNKATIKDLETQRNKLEKEHTALKRETENLEEKYNKYKAVNEKLIKELKQEIKEKDIAIQDLRKDLVERNIQELNQAKNGTPSNKGKGNYKR